MRCCDVGQTGTMAVFAADGEFDKRRLLKTSIAIQHWARLAAMARDARRKNRTVETVVAKFVTRRKRPTIRFRIERERRLEEVAVLLHDSPASVCSRADDPIEFASFAKNIFAVGFSFVLALIKIVVLHRYLEMAIQPGIKDVSRRRYPFQKLRSDLRH